MSALSNLWGGFTGSSANNALNQGYQQQRRDLQSGFDEGRGYGERYLSQANEYMQPYATQGRQASDLYGNLNGVNGADAARTAWQGFQAPPGFQEASDYGARQTQNSAAARGSMYNGNTLSALYNQASGARYGAQNDWLQRLNGIGQQGYAASSGMADRTSGFGNALMQGRMNLGNQLAGAAGQNAQGLAANSNTFTQNLLGVAGVAASAMTGMPMRGGGGGSGGTFAQGWNGQPYRGGSARLPWSGSGNGSWGYM
jgi:hypothetical protein